MSEMYGFGPDDEMGASAQEPESGNSTIRALRAKAEADSKAIQEMREQIQALQTESTRAKVAEALTAKGYAPQAAGLYTGTPDKLDDWLSANGAALAKTDGSAVEQGQGMQGVPQTAISPESQAAQAAFAAAGSGAASGQSGDDQLVSRMNAANSMDELDQIMRENGSRFF